MNKKAELAIGIIAATGITFGIIALVSHVNKPEHPKFKIGDKIAHKDFLSGVYTVAGFIAATEQYPYGLYMLSVEGQSGYGNAAVDVVDQDYVLVG